MLLRVTSANSVGHSAAVGSVSVADLLPRAVKFGYMEKLGYVHKRWRRRFFVTDGEYLYWFLNEDSDKQRGQIILNDVIETTVGYITGEEETMEKPTCLVLMLSGRKFFIDPCSTQEQCDWYLVLRSKKQMMEDHTNDRVMKFSAKRDSQIRGVPQELLQREVDLWISPYTSEEPVRIEYSNNRWEFRHNRLVSLDNPYHGLEWNVSVEEMFRSVPQKYLAAVKLSHNAMPCYAQFSRRDITNPFNYVFEFVSILGDFRRVWISYLYKHDTKMFHPLVSRNSPRFFYDEEKMLLIPQENSPSDSNNNNLGGLSVSLSSSESDGSPSTSVSPHSPQSPPFTNLLLRITEVDASESKTPPGAIDLKQIPAPIGLFIATCSDILMTEVLEWFEDFSRELQQQASFARLSKITRSKS